MTFNKRDLVEYLAGRRTLKESNFSAPGVAANVGLPPMWTGRQERLSQAWNDIEVKLEALFLDVLDSSEPVYAQCMPLLKDIRASKGESCHENLPRFEALYRILQLAGQQDENFARYSLHMEELVGDLQWMCDQLAPKDPRTPEAPAQAKADWKAQKGMKTSPDTSAADYTFAARQEAKHVQKEQALRPFCPSSLVMASLARAGDSANESSGSVESTFLAAGDAVRLCLEAYTDIQGAHIAVGMAVPGFLPRLDLVCEWGTTIGKASLYWSADDRGPGLVIEGSSTDFLSMSETLTDLQVAQRLYSCLDTREDLSPRRVWTEARVVPTLYKMIERTCRGQGYPMYEWDAVVDLLRARIGLNEAIRLTPDQIRIHRVNESATTQFFYHYDWEQRYQEPFPFKNGELTQGDHDDREIVKTILDDPKMEVAEGAYSETWTSGRLKINFETRSVSIVDGDGEEETLPPDTKDEDAAARLLSLSFQKESHEHLSEEWEEGFKASLAEAKATCSNCGGSFPPSEMRGTVCRKCANEINRPDIVPAKDTSGPSKGGKSEATSLPFEWEGALREHLAVPTLFEQDEWNPKEHPRDRESGEFVDGDSATPAQKKAAYRASKKPAKTPEPGLISDPDDAETLVTPDEPSLTKGAVEQPPDDKSGEVNKAGYAGWNQEPEKIPTGDKEVPDQEQSPAQEPEKAPETPSGNTEDPVQQLQKGAIRRDNPDLDSIMQRPDPAGTQAAAPADKEVPPGQDQKGTVSRYNPDLDAIFGPAAEKPPEAPFQPAEPKAKVPDPPKPPPMVMAPPGQPAQAEDPFDPEKTQKIQIPPGGWDQEEPKEEPKAQEPEAPPSQEPTAEEPPPAQAPRVMAPPRIQRELASPFIPGMPDQEARRIPEQLGQMTPEEWQQARDYVYDQAKVGLEGQESALDMKKMEAEAKKDVDDQLAILAATAEKAGKEFEGMAPEEYQKALHDAMRERLEDAFDKQVAKINAGREEEIAWRKAFWKKAWGQITSLAGFTYDEFWSMVHQLEEPGAYTPTVT